MMEDKLRGRVLRIEKSSLHDGNGLRTVVFLRGCPLRCLWCSTPESQSGKVEFGFRGDFCVGCGKCAVACPAGALQMEAGRPVRNREACTLCGKCAHCCPKGAWLKYGMDLTVEETVREIEKDSLFFFYSGGGVTFSGGEPFLQPEYVGAVMRECCDRGIETAVETSLSVPWKNIEPVLPYLGWMFADVKAMDPETHRRVTGQSNEMILDNLRNINASPHHFPVHVRIPVIPGINNDRENLRKTVEFCDALEKIVDIELLPYHRLGAETYRNLGKPYQLEKVVTPSAEEMRDMADYMRRLAGRVEILV